VEGGLDAAAERDGPGLAENREVLDRLVIDLVEAEIAAGVGLVVCGHAVVAAAARVARGGPPVEAHRRLRVDVGDVRIQAGGVNPVSTEGNDP
jgi:hypothetical protein